MSLELQAEKRNVAGKAVKRFRKEGKIPAVLYGHGIEPRNVFVLYNPFSKLFKEAGESTLVDLYIEGKPHKVLIQDVQYDPVRGTFDHIDFREVAMTEKLEADIVLRFAGESRAVKELGGILVKNVLSLKVRCLPQYLVHEIEVNLAPLAEFGDVIRVSDVSFPEGLEILTNHAEVLATVTAPREEEAAPVAEVDLSAIKTVGEEKRAVKAAEKEAEKAAEEKAEK